MGMRTYIVKRLFQVIPTVLFVIVINFFIINLAPGDPALTLAGMEAPKEFVELLRERFGLNKPLWERFVIYVTNVLRGDLGYSFIHNRPVIEVVLDRAQATLLLTGTAMLFAVALGLFLGVSASKRPYSKLDVTSTTLSLILYSMPAFWTGLMLLLVFGLYLRWLPVQGMFSVGMDLTGFSYIVDIARHLILPAFTLGAIQLALYTRLTRASMLEVLRQDYITTAWAKGLEERSVFFDHALKNALLPVVTIIGLRLGFLLVGATVIEVVFAWPGMGRLMYEAIFSRDYPLLMGNFIITAIMVIMANFFTDLLYAVLDPRIRFK